MALINCPDCEKELSNNARNCVHCGYRNQKSVFSQDLGFDGEFFKIVLSLGLVCSLAGFFIGWWLVVFGISLVFMGTILLVIRSLR